MKKQLQTIARQLTEDQIQELMRLKRAGGKKAVALRKKRDKLAETLAAVEAQLAEMEGEAAPKARRARRAKAESGDAPVARSRKTPAKKRGGKRRVNLTATVREIVGQAGAPLRARDIVDALPGMGIKVKNTADMRKRISVVLASQKNSFEQVSRGMYQLKG